MNDLLKWRGEFPILEKSTYMISNSLGAMPRAVYDSMRRMRIRGGAREFARGKRAGGRWRSAWATKSRR